RAGAILPPEIVEVEAVELLLRLRFDANVRELESWMVRALSSEPTRRLTLRALQAAGATPGARRTTLTRESVQSALDACRGNETQAAKKLGVSRAILRRFREP